MSDEERILLEIVTPKGRALSEVVDEVTVPAQNGEFGVLPGHLPTLANLRTGIVTYRKATETFKCAVASGFVEVGPSKVVVLSDDFILRPGVDPVIVRTELAAVQADIARAEQEASESDAALQERLKGPLARESWLAAQLELYGDPPPATMRPYDEVGPAVAVVDEANEPATGR